MNILITAKFCAAIIAMNKEGQFSAEIQAMSSEGEKILVWSDTFFDPLTAAQAMQKALGEVQS